MDDLIPISAINDFLFCPHSLYYHSLYSSFNEKTYHQKPQIEGRLNHVSVDSGKYTTSRCCLQGLPVYCERYGLVGKIDTFFVDTGILVERKTKVKRIYDGYRYQLYAQFFALTEMGYKVEQLFIHSLTDNKRYPIPIPNQADVAAFEQVLTSMRSFDIAKSQHVCNPKTHETSIYKELY